MPRREIKIVVDVKLGPIAKELSDVLLVGNDALLLIDGSTPRGRDIRERLSDSLLVLGEAISTRPNLEVPQFVTEEPVDSDGANGDYQGGDSP